ncbi:MAG: MBOAT family O-acyltransferase [Kiritimatiellia bacterium]|jgi:alginate O-acetyltransferase complex protein AlgI
MVFSSPIFLALFLPILLAAYLLAPTARRNAVLLAGSLFFYAWGEPRAIVVMLALIVASHGIAHGIAAAHSHDDRIRARHLLALGIILNLGALAALKYLSFIIVNLNRLPGVDIPDPKIPLPIGISFYVFQILSYLIDVHRRETRTAGSLSEFALYVSLFPQLIAGPIVRYTTIRDDMKDRRWIPDNVFSGLQRFASGLAKKVLLADTFALVADTVFKSPVGDIPWGFAWIGIVAYALQIFYDFSGYSDMAIGLGRVFNFHFLENFDHPYCATSIREFWRRWHISLSTWFRDYLYIPLGGNRVSFVRTCFNQGVVFLLCGLWHGADWNFAIWGLLHGFGLSMERLLHRSKRLAALRIPPIVGNLYVWLFVLVGWVFFRAPSLDYALAFLKIMFTGNAARPFSSFWPALGFYHHGMLVAAAVGFVLCYPALPARVARLERRPAGAALSLAVFLVAYTFAMTSNYSPFIYFRF